MKAKIKIYNSAQGYDLAAGSYDKKEKYLNSFEQGKMPAILGDLTEKKVLDAGAGTGRLAVEMAEAGAAVTALDASPEMLKILKRKNPRIETIVGEVESLPFPGNSFDLVVAAFLIVHLKDPAVFFDECYRVLKDGGFLLVTNINQKEPPAVPTAQGDIKIESYYHRPEKIREILESLAFSVENEELVKENGIWINQIILAKK